MARGSKYPDEVKERARAFARMGRTVKEIADVHGFPEERTIRNWVRSVPKPKPEDAWSPREDADNAAYVLPVLAALVLASQGRRRTLTKAEANMVAVIGKLAPGCPPELVLQLTLVYVNRLPQEDTDALDAFLAFRPWSGNQSHKTYLRALANGWAPPAPANVLALLHFFETSEEWNAEVEAMLAEELDQSERDLLRQQGIDGTWILNQLMENLREEEDLEKRLREKLAEIGTDRFIEAFTEFKEEWLRMRERQRERRHEDLRSLGIEDDFEKEEDDGKAES